MRRGASVLSAQGAECPGPPEGARVVEMLAYRGTVITFDEGAGGFDFGFYGESTNHGVCDDGRYRVGDDYADGVADACVLSLSLTVPYSYPRDYLGVYTYSGESLYSVVPAFDGGVACAPGELSSGYWTAHSPAGGAYGTNTSNSAICIDAIGPDRIGGTMLFGADLERIDTPDEPSGWARFDLVFDNGEPGADSWNDGTCFYYFPYPLTEDEMWDPAFWDAWREEHG